MAITAQQVSEYLQANPMLTDAQIASLANQYGVSAQTLSQATNIPVAQVEQRAVTAGTPLTAGTGMMAGATTPAPAATTPAATAAAPAATTSPQAFAVDFVKTFLKDNPKLTDKQIADLHFHRIAKCDSL